MEGKKFIGFKETGWYSSYILGFCFNKDRLWNGAKIAEPEKSIGYGVKTRKNIEKAISRY